MINYLKSVLKKTDIVDAFLKRKHILDWAKNGYSVPVTQAVKQLTVQYYAITYKIRTMVETGTYLGDMVWAQRNVFQRIYSIELSEELFRKAEKRFKNFKQITIIQGDSGVKLREVLTEVKEPCLFWLDGHYSGGSTALGDKVCPIYAELSTIFLSGGDHIILIDDARLFNGTEDYPTLADLQTFVGQHAGRKMKIENDIIVLY